MDQDFLAELDVALSNVGSDEVWRRTIGGVELWISPLQILGQEKVAEVITKTDLGANIISESKRMTLSHAIVGFDKFDLREWRGGAAVFPVTGKDGKPAKTTLDRYLYHKLGSWGAQFIDDAFAVYADLMDSFQKNNLKDIKFENAKDPREELAELQARVYELRQQLGLPMLVDPAELADREQVPPEEEAQPAPKDDFNPFERVPPVPPVQASPRPAAPPQPPSASAPLSPVVPDPASAQRAAQRAAEAAELELSSTSFPDQAPPQPAPAVQAPPQPPPVRLDVVDTPASRAPVSPPVIDRVPTARNPRFRPPQQR